MDETKRPPSDAPDRDAYDRDAHDRDVHDRDVNPGPGHETSDVNVWAIGKFAIGLVVVCLVSLILLLGLVKFFQSREATSVANTIEPSKVFPEPQLQRTPSLDLKAVRAAEDQLLNGYAWVDPKKGLVRIPIDQAIDVLAKRGLPSRAKSGVQTAAGDVSAPSESGQGIKPLPEGRSK